MPSFYAAFSAITEASHSGRTIWRIIEIAQESERGIIDMETVRYSNEQLIASLDEVIRIQEEGRIKRREAEKELGDIEATLKQKLLDIRNQNGAKI